MGGTGAAVHGDLAAGRVTAVVERVDIERAHVERTVDHKGLHVLLHVADVQAHQAGCDRALNAFVFAVGVALAIEAGSCDLDQARVLAALAGDAHLRLTRSHTAQAGDGVAHQVDLGPTQFKALQGLAGFGALRQLVDVAIGHVQGDGRIGPVRCLDHQASAQAIGRNSNADTALDHGLGALVQVQSQVPTDQAVVGRHRPARIGGGAQGQGLRGDLRAVGHAHARTGGTVDGVKTGECHVLLQRDRNLRRQHHRAADLHVACHKNAGAEPKLARADRGKPQIAGETVLGREQHIAQAGDAAGGGQLDMLHVHRQAGRPQVQRIQDQAVLPARAPNAQNAGRLGKHQVQQGIATQARQTQHAVACIAQADLGVASTQVEHQGR